MSVIDLVVISGWEQSGKGHVKTNLTSLGCEIMCTRTGDIVVLKLVIGGAPELCRIRKDLTESREHISFLIDTVSFV